MIWLKKIFVTFVAVLTFGTVAPNSHASTDRSQASKSNRLEKSASDLKIDSVREVEAVRDKDSNTERDGWSQPWQEVAAGLTDQGELKERLVGYTVKQAEKQSFQKFGPAIQEQVGDEFRDEILPKVGEVMKTVAGNFDEDTMRNLVISNSPTGGFGEKIFHIYDARTSQDLVRFHVRRDHPPKDGYWFNFHYHVPSDHFQGHHELGNIFWDKDTPPQWRA